MADDEVGVLALLEQGTRVRHGRPQPRATGPRRRRHQRHGITLAGALPQPQRRSVGTKPTSNETVPGKRAQRSTGEAEQFANAAELIDELAGGDQNLCDAFVTLCVHAGIAAADVICCAKLGRHATGESHDKAKRLVGLVDPGAGQALGTLLGMKTKAGYSALR